MCFGCVDNTRREAVFDGATGIGVVDRMITDVLQRSRANSDGRPLRASELLVELDLQGIPPGLAFDHVALSVQRSLVWVRLFRPRGNLGSRVDPPAAPRYVGVALSGVGELVAGGGQALRLPVGFINGNMHDAGSRPAFAPSGVLDAIVLAASTPAVPDHELVDLVGPPTFPSGIEVEGDLDALHAGAPSSLTLKARVEPDGTGAHLVLTGIPPNANPDEVLQSLFDRASAARRPPATATLAARALPLAEIKDHSDSSQERYVLVPTSGVPLEELRTRLLGIWGVTTTITARLPASTSAIIRHHAAGDPDQVAEAAGRLRELVT